MVSLERDGKATIIKLEQLEGRFCILLKWNDGEVWLEDNWCKFPYSTFLKTSIL